MPRPLASLASLAPLAPLFLLFLLFLLPAPSAAQDIDTIPGYRLVWHDEFDTDGPYAPHWTPEVGFVRNKELQWYQGANASVKDGCLIITGKRETVTNPNYDASTTTNPNYDASTVTNPNYDASTTAKPEGDNWRTSRPEAHYTSASLTTANSFTFKYGRVLVRAKMPSVCGSWPAIWLKGNMWEWPHKGEIDMMEYYPTHGVPAIHANACWGGKSRYASVWDSASIPVTHFTASDPEWAHKFHIWRMDWDEAYIRLYIDDELLNEIDLSKTCNQGYNGNRENPFSNNIPGFGAYILLNLAIGSTGGTPDPNTFPIHYLIDYVRIYQTHK